MRYLIWRLRSADPRLAVAFVTIAVSGGALLVTGLASGDGHTVLRTALMVLLAVAWFFAPFAWFLATRNRNGETASRHRDEPRPPWLPR
ncbi:hypothetical protein [Nocardioides ultimimeridianus]